MEEVELAMAKQWWTGKAAGEISQELYAAARMLFPMPEWITMEEIEIPGSSRGRRADLVAISIWGPAARAVVLELKATRADFLNEIQDPTKRAPGMRFGTEFSFVVPHGLVHIDEVPEGCGLYEVQRNRRVRRVRIGTQRDAPEWTPFMVHEMVKKLAFRCDPTYRAFADAGQNGRKAFRDIFRAYGREWTLDDLIDLSKAVTFGLRVREHDAALAKLDYKTRRDQDPNFLELMALREKVTELCGWQCNTAEQFEQWFKKHGRSKVKLRDDREIGHLVGSVQRNMERLAAMLMKDDEEQAI